MRVTSGTNSRTRLHPFRERGFTLIELLVVLAILVMMASLLPLAIDRVLPSRRVATTSQRLITAIRDAQSESLASGRPVLLELDARAGLSRSARVVVGLPPATTVRLEDLDGHPLRELTVQPDGSLPAARFEIESVNHSSTVVVSGMTGRVTLEGNRRAR